MDGANTGAAGRRAAVAAALLSLALAPAGPHGWAAAADRDGPVDATSLRGKVLCGYQGWFRCPGDAADLGWIHWSRDSRRLAPSTLTFDLWPDMSEYAAGERF